MINVFGPGSGSDWTVIMNLDDDENSAICIGFGKTLPDALLYAKNTLTSALNDVIEHRDKAIAELHRSLK